MANFLTGPLEGTVKFLGEVHVRDMPRRGSIAGIDTSSMEVLLPKEKSEANEIMETNTDDKTR